MMHGRDKRSASYHALAFLVLGGIGFATLAVPAIASNQVNVNVSPTTGYFEVTDRTYRTPSNVRVGGLPAVPTVSAIPAGGLSQALPSGIEITGIRGGQTLNTSFSASLRAGAGTLKTAATRCLTSFRCNVAAAGASLGLQALLDGVDWVMDSAGHPVGSLPSVVDPQGPNDYYWRITEPFGFTTREFSSSAAACGFMEERYKITSNWIETVTVVVNADNRVTCFAEGGSGGSYQSSNIGSATRYGTRCQPGSSYDSDIGGCTVPGEELPIDSSIIGDRVSSSYEPHPSDWPWLSGAIDLSSPDVDIEIVDIPSITGADSPDYIERSDGTSQGTYSEYEFSLSGNPGKQPSISVRESTTSTEFDGQGNPVSSSTTTSQSSASAPPSVDIPTDCEFMPTVCRFIDWFTEPDPSPDPDDSIRDLVQVYEDGGRDVVVGSETGSCPPPRTIQLSLVPPVEFSFQPFCDLATAVRFWFLAIASFGAAYMTVRSI